MADRRLLTTQEVVDLIEAETGSAIAPATFRSYVARGQAPRPAERRANTPFYRRKEILEWAHNRPGTGARTDIAARSRPQRNSPPQSSGEPKQNESLEVSTEVRATSVDTPRKPARRAAAKTAAERTRAKSEQR